jgi:hypothetical protein
VSRLDAVVGGVLDGALEAGVLAFAVWTVLYHLGLAVGARATVVLALWFPVAIAIVVLRARGRRARPVHGRAANVLAALVSLACAVLASLLVRPDLDDASYVVRSTWVAQRDDLGARDIVFSGGVWGPLVGQDPYLPSFEALLGVLARATGISPGSMVYLLWAPVGAAAAVWALWTLLRSWRTRVAPVALLLGVVVVLWGGAVHASWGNFHLGRIWQGKTVLVAVLVPAAYAWCAAYWRSTPGARRRGALALVTASGVAAVGLSPAGVFVLPEVAVVGAVVGLVARRPGRAVLLAAAGCAYPLLAGLVTRLVGNVGEAAATVGAPVNPWVRTLGQGWPAAVVALAALAGLLGVLLPRWSGIGSPAGRATAAASVVTGALIGLPPVFDVLARVMGTDAIAWRALWVVPVPALVGTLAGWLPGTPRLRPAVGALVAAALVVGGLPIWSSANHAELTRSPRWKFPPQDLVTARWLADHAPREGTYLARTNVVPATGVMTSELRPVGSRPDYLVHYADLPEAQVVARGALQQWVDGGPGTADPVALGALFDALDVRAVCAVGDRRSELGGAWREAARPGVDTCWLRD